MSSKQSNQLKCVKQLFQPKQSMTGKIMNHLKLAYLKRGIYMYSTKKLLILHISYINTPINASHLRPLVQSLCF